MWGAIHGDSGRTSEVRLMSMYSTIRIDQQIDLNREKFGSSQFDAASINESGSRRTSDLRFVEKETQFFAQIFMLSNNVV